jgi:hypothetical protein
VHDENEQHDILAIYHSLETEQAMPLLSLPVTRRD